MTATFTETASFTENDTFTEDDTARVVPPHAGSTTRRRRIRFSAAGLAVAGVLLALGAVMTSNANFSRTYVTEQLVRQGITFKPVDALTGEERKSDCVVANAGKLMTTGKQAECFANEFLGLHVQQLGKGRTYAELGDTQTDLRARIAAAQAKGDPAVAGLQKEMADLTSQRELVFKAEMLRGILLTSFGFSELGEKGAQAATAAFGAAGLVGLLSVAGMAHALRRPKTRSVTQEPVDRYSSATT